MDFLSDETLGISDADRANILRDVSEHVDHTLELLNSLLDIAQIESGKLELVSDVIDVQLFLDDVVTQHARTAFSKGTSVVLEGTPEGTIMADPTRLRQVIDNLISNAVKYSPGGSTIRVWAECVEDVWRFNIQDEGPGIGPEDRLRLFQDFARLSALPTGGERSTGLGLAISRRIVEAHHGQIDVDPAPGHGSIFWFTLPT
jgi:signal transduction histidine kinase